MFVHENVWKVNLLILLENQELVKYKFKAIAMVVDDPSQTMISKTPATLKVLGLLALSVLYALLIHTANGKVHHHKFVVSASFSHKRWWYD